MDTDMDMDTEYGSTSGHQLLISKKKKVFLKSSILKIKSLWPENKGFLGKLKGFTHGKKGFFTACNSNKNSNK